MKFYWLLLGLLTVWRLTHFLFAEDGPWGVVVRFRRRAGRGLWGELLDCFYCLSVWIALPVAVVVGSGWLERIFLWPALSAGAILLERINSRDSRVTPPAYTEDPETIDHVVLRQTASAIQPPTGGPA